MRASQGISPSGNVTILTVRSATGRVSPSQGLSVFATTSGSVIYNGIGFHTGSSSIWAILIALTTLYLTI